MLTSIGYKLLLLSPPAAHPHPHTFLCFSSSSSSSSSPIPTPKSQSSSTSATLINPTKDSALRKLEARLDPTAKADAVVCLLEQYGLSDAHISKMVAKHPRILRSKPDKTVKPKLDFFLSLGFSHPALAGFIAGVPAILTCSLQNNIVPLVDFLRGIFGTDESVVSMLYRNSSSLFFGNKKSMQPAVQALRDHGWSDEQIARVVRRDPSILMRHPDRVGEIADAVKATGLDPSKAAFVHAFRVMGLRRSTLERKMAVYRRFGFSESEALMAFRRFPSCMGISEQKIEKGLQFFVGVLKFSPAQITTYPTLLAFGFEKTILPRCAVLSLLMREGKIGDEVNLPAVLQCNEKRFLKRFVSTFQHDVPGVLKAHQGEIKFEGFGDQLVLSDSDPLKHSSRVM